MNKYISRKVELKIFKVQAGQIIGANFSFDLGFSVNFKILKFMEKIYVEHASSICYNIFGSSITPYGVTNLSC